MKRIKKLLALVMAMTMLLGLGLTVSAKDGLPEVGDKADVTITGLKGNPTVTLYQIAKVKYGPNGHGFVDYLWAGEDNSDLEKNNSLFQNVSEPTADEINAIAQNLLSASGTDGHLKPLDTIGPEKVTNETFTKTVGAGAYIAIITGAEEDGTVYNPILLTASYGTKDNAGNLVGGSIGAGSNYLYGSTAVAKSTTPGIDKELTAGATVDDSDSVNGEKNTASVGEVLTYTVTPTMPNYPTNATNKTFFISDTMSSGLTFDFNSLDISIEDQQVTKNPDDNTFLLGDAVIATAFQTANGFNLNFNYDKLISDSTSGAVYQPIVTYKATVNGNAVVGGDGNPNKAELYYANEPNNGKTWEEVESKPEPDKADGVFKKEDSETVYTYQLGFRKVDSENDEKFLEGAVFGIYANKDCTKLVDKVKTNTEGYAFSTNVAAGTYYIKELYAPQGYTLNEQVYKINASWTSATTTVTGTIIDRTYTTKEPSKDAVQVGWIKDGVFYALDEFNEETAAAGSYQKAYLDTENVTTTSNTTTAIPGDAGAGSVLLGENIKNTTIANLPSTGGIGTTIFTVGGCIIMIAAAALYFVNRRRSEDK